MKIPNPRKLSSGNWFIQMRLGGESVSVTESTEKKCVATARLLKAEYLAGKRENATKGHSLTLRQAMDKYITSRSNTLSPSTIRGYTIIKENRFQSIIDKPIKDITDWQSVCNAEVKLCATKTLRNAWMFVMSVLREAGEEAPKVSLPQVTRKERPYLDPDEIKLFVAAVEGTACEMAALLALHSLRISEICALMWNKNIDLQRKRIFVSGALVPDKDNNFVLKEANKNASSRRYVPIMMDVLYNKLKNCPIKEGRVVVSSPTMINKQINRICIKHGLPLVGVHGLRHSFASLAYHLRMPEQIAMQIGGWSDYGTMRKIYTHLSQKDIAKYELEMTKFFNNANDNANDA